MNAVDAGKIVTFYSFKGGVGRSMSVANAAVLLARDQGKKVVVVDWDLEAPGLHRFFKMSDLEIRDGLVDYLLRYKELLREPRAEVDSSHLDVTACLIPVKRYPSGGSIRLLAAGSQVDRSQYAERVNQFDWRAFYADWKGASLVELMRQQLKAAADFVLVDSRTGITDIGGICTLQLPDTVVFVFAFNDQNIDGVDVTARDISSGSNAFQQVVERRPEILLLPSRKELAQINELRAWEQRAADKLGRYVSPERWGRYGSAVDYVREVAVPYVPWFAFGEELAADSDKGYEMIKPYKLLVGQLTGEVAREPPRPASHTVSRIARFLTPKMIGFYLVLAALLTLAAKAGKLYFDQHRALQAAEQGTVEARRLAAENKEQADRASRALDALTQSLRDHNADRKNGTIRPPDAQAGGGYSIVLGHGRRCDYAMRTLAKVRARLHDDFPDLDLGLLGLAEGWTENDLHTWAVSYGRGTLDLGVAKELVKKMAGHGAKREVYVLKRLALFSAVCPDATGNLPVYDYRPHQIHWGTGLPQDRVFMSSTENCKVGAEESVAKHGESAEMCRLSSEASDAYEGLIDGKLIIWWPPVFGKWPRCACTPKDGYRSSKERAFPAHQP